MVNLFEPRIRRSPNENKVFLSVIENYEKIIKLKYNTDDIRVDLFHKYTSMFNCIFSCPSICIRIGDRIIYEKRMIQEMFRLKI